MVKNLKELFEKYDVEISFDENAPDAVLTVSPPESRPGRRFTVFGTFRNGRLEDVEVTGLQMEGFFDDIRDQDINEDWYFQLIESVLMGNYHYELETRSLKDRIVSGAVYITIFSNRKIILHHRCDSQRSLKKKVLSGELEPEPYDAASTRSGD